MSKTIRRPTGMHQRNNSQLAVRQLGYPLTGTVGFDHCYFYTVTQMIASAIINRFSPTFAQATKTEERRTGGV